MEVADGVRVLDDAVAVLVGLPVDEALLEAPAGQPQAEAVGVVVAAVGALHERRPAELAREDDEGLVEEAAGAEVLDEAGHGLVDGQGVGGVALDQLGVLVPRVGGLPHAVGAHHGELDEADAALDEAAGHEALAPVGGGRRDGRVQAVEALGGLGLAREVDELGHRGLHAVGDLVVVDGRLHLPVAADAVDEGGVEVADEAQAAPLPPVRLAGLHVAEGLGVLGIEHRALVDRGQEAVAEDVDPAQGDAAAAEDHEPGQVLVLGAEAVGHPRAHAGEAVERHAAVEVEVGLGVLHERGGHRADDGQLVGHAADVGEERAHRDAALAVVRELPGARPDVAVLVEHRPLGLERHRPPRLGREPRLGVERVDVREPPRHVAEDDVPHLGREVRRLRGQRAVARLLREARVGPVGHQGRQRQQAEAGRGLAQHLAARQERAGGGVTAWIKAHGKTSARGVRGATSCWAWPARRPEPPATLSGLTGRTGTPSG